VLKADGDKVLDLIDLMLIGVIADMIKTSCDGSKADCGAVKSEARKAEVTARRRRARGLCGCADL
jgi:hypothetical protein